MLRKPLSKTSLQQGSQCPRMLWIKHNIPNSADSPNADEDNSQFQIGDIVGAAAQEKFPKTVVVNTSRGFSPENYASYAAETKSYMNNKEIECIAEATFYYDNVVVFIDLLKRDVDQNGREVWDIYEVKASGVVQPHQAQDAAWQTYVAKQCGVPVRKTYLMHPGRGTHTFTVGNGEFEVVDMWSDWIAKTASSSQMPETIKKFKDIVSSETPPACECTPGSGECCVAPYKCNYVSKCRELFEEEKGEQNEN